MWWTVFVIFAGLIDLSVCSLPMLNIDGFSWAENLVFDGLGGLFVSEAIRGQLWRVSFDSSSNSYNATVHISKNFKQFGGLSVSPDGKTVFAAAVTEDKVNSILSTSTLPALIGEKSYSFIAKDLDELPNGMALVPDQNALYFTSEKGTLTKVDISTGKVTLVTDQLAKPDGLWFDTSSKLLFVSELVKKRMKVFDTGTNTFSEYYSFGENLGKVHFIDDITLVSDVNKENLGKTEFVAADWTGRAVVHLTLDGQFIKTIPPPDGIAYFEPTSVRRGKGPGFDSNSFYITEGGGLTRHAHNRRVLQLGPLTTPGQ